MVIFTAFLTWDCEIYSKETSTVESELSQPSPLERRQLPCQQPQIAPCGPELPTACSFHSHASRDAMDRAAADARAAASMATPAGGTTVAALPLALRRRGSSPAMRRSQRGEVRMGLPPRRMPTSCASDSTAARSSTSSRSTAASAATCKMELSIGTDRAAQTSRMKDALSAGPIELAESICGRAEACCKSSCRSARKARSRAATVPASAKTETKGEDRRAHGENRVTRKYTVWSIMRACAARDPEM